jgi:hypothetical protein
VSSSFSSDIVRSVVKVNQFCIKEGFVGYSLYDSHNSPIRFAKLGPRVSFLVNQFIKRSPINFRPILGVKKGINPKGYGLFLHAYSLLTKMNLLGQSEAEEMANFFFDWLLHHPSKGYSGHCWGYNYLWPHKDGKDVPAYMPSVVVTGFVARAMLAYFQALGDSRVKNVLTGAVQFVLNHVHLYKGEDGYCFSYTPLKKDLTVNANLLAAEVLAYCDYLNGQTKYRETIEKVIEFTFNTQNDDGSWYYSFDYDTRKPKKQIDFHQGYVLESLLRLSQYASVDFSNYKAAIQKGLHFYKRNQFHKDGWAYWRLPTKWPVDIHNQSQGIITFSAFKDFSEDYLPFAKKIAKWTIANMQDPKGNFHYQKWPLFSNKVNYLRWNQAWMLLALTTYLSNIE